MPHDMLQALTWARTFGVHARKDSMCQSSCVHVMKVSCVACLWLPLMQNICCCSLLHAHSPFAADTAADTANY
jgi:hypothetical protein